MGNYKDKNFIDTIIKAVNEDRLVLFVGNGLSRLCGLPSWDELADNLLHEYVSCNEKDENYDYAFLEKVKNEKYDARRKMTIARNLFRKKYGNDTNFNKLLCEKLSLDKISDNSEVVSNNIKKIREIVPKISRKIITTNADKLLDECVDKKHVFYKIEDFKNEMLSDKFNAVMHIHGSINDYKTLVFTADQYLKTYANENFRNVISNLFSEGKYTILFIGYGMNELQLLDFLVNTGKPEDRLDRTFLLNGYYRNNDEIIEVDEDYYKEYGINLITFNLDKNKYCELIEVLLYINRQVESYSKRTSSNIKDILNIFSTSPTPENVQLIINRYPSLNEEQKNLVGTCLFKSRFYKIWVKEVIRNDDLQDTLKIDEIFPNAKAYPKCVDGKDFLILSLLSVPGLYIDNIDDTYKNITKKIMELCRTNNEVINDENIVISLMNILYSNDKFIGKDSSIEFAEHLSKYGYVNYLLNNFTYFKKIYTEMDAVKSVKYLSIILKSKFLDYMLLELLFEKMYDYFSFEAAKETAELLVNVASQLYSKNKFSYDAYEECNNIYLSDKYKVMRKWIAFFAQKLSDDDALKLYDNYIKTSDEFLRLTAIYIANTHFSVLKESFLSNLCSLSQRIYFSEIYSYFKNNTTYLDDEDYNLYIAEYISNLNFNNEEFINKISKLEILKILSKRYPNLSGIVTSIEKNLSDDEKIEHRRVYSNPLNISKAMFVSEGYFYNEGKEFKEKLLKLDLNHFIEEIRKDPKEQVYESYIATIADTLSNYKFKDKIYERVLDGTLTDLPEYFIGILESNILSLKKSTNDKLNIILKLEKENQNLKHGRCLMPIFYCLIGNSDEIDDGLKNKIFDLANNFETNDENFTRCFVNNSSFELEESETYSKYSILLIVCTLKNKKSLFEKLDLAMKDNNSEKGKLVKAAMAFMINKIYELDKEWAKNHLSCIFENEYKEINLSYKAYGGCGVIKKEFALDLNETGHFEKLINSSEFDVFSHPFSVALIYMYLEDKELYNLITPIISSNNYGFVLNDLILKIDHTNKDLFNVTNFKTLIDLIINENKKVKHLDFAARTMIKYHYLIQNKNIILKFCQFAFSYGAEAMLAVEIYSSLRYSRMDSKITSEIIYCFLRNVRKCYNAVHQIISLYKMMEVDEKRKQEVKNHLSTENPALIDQLEQ